MKNIDTSMIAWMVALAIVALAIAWYRRRVNKHIRDSIERSARRAREKEEAKPAKPSDNVEPHRRAEEPATPESDLVVAIVAAMNEVYTVDTTTIRSRGEVMGYTVTKDTPQGNRTDGGVVYYTTQTVDLGFYGTLDKALDAAVEAGAVEDSKIAALRRRPKAYSKPPHRRLPGSIFDDRDYFVADGPPREMLPDIVIALNGHAGSVMRIAPVYEPPRK
jgi:hypothetical protein